jgi:hypothetical protein
LNEEALNKGREWVALEMKKRDLWKVLEKVERESSARLDALKVTIFLKLI